MPTEARDARRRGGRADEQVSQLKLDADERARRNAEKAKDEASTAVQALQQREEEVEAALGALRGSGGGGAAAGGVRGGGGAGGA